MANRKKDKEPVGYEILKDASLNKGTAFTMAERETYKLRGLLPAAVSDQDMQITRALGNVRRKAYDIERYIYLQALQARNERLFYRLIIDHIEELMPIIYTPTVGQACKEFAHIFRQPRGFYINPDDRGQIRSMLDNWPERDISLIVVTDGERILGLGDLGASGMGIPLGKLALYSACAGIPPHQCLPVMLDVGTNNETLRSDPLYLGVPRPRITGADYLALVEEFVLAVQDAYPRALIQFEDFLTPNAYGLLHTWRDRVLCFNDDIQGTAAVALAGVLASSRITGIELPDLRIMFLGAGSAATGIANLIRFALRDAGLDQQQATRRIWLVDHTGLVVKQRDDLAPQKRPYAHDAPAAGFIEAIRMVKPHVLIGATGKAAMFTEEAIRLMAELNPRPVIFALSNPTSVSECTAEQAFEWSEGRAVFASGSPFPPVSYAGKSFRPGQGNNAYIFPGIGLGAIACQASRISDEMFLDAARVLAEMVTEDDLQEGAIYPPLTDIRRASLAIAVAVAEKAWDQGLARVDRPADVEKAIADTMYDPHY
ncbi:MAG: NAD-dependent malic enzyme [Thiotrichales bacterium]|nr:MAG: NAD-dependent malic enzyme [Thiotrichales bacterium]